MTATTSPARPWSVVVVEDDAQIRSNIIEYFNGEAYPFGIVKVEAIASFDLAREMLEQRKIDLLILDVFAGPTNEQKQEGIAVLDMWKKTGFAPVILHTALPEGLGAHVTAFVRLVGKEPNSLEKIEEEMVKFFALKIPQVRRGILEHLDASFRDYMWGFVVDNWDELASIVDKPDFVRLLVQRLSMRLSREGIAALLDGIHPAGNATDTAPALVHPAQYYVKPVATDHHLLGDIVAIGPRHAVLLQPSCDLVVRGEKGCKVESVLLAWAKPLDETDEHKRWSKSVDSLAKAVKAADDAKAALDAKKETEAKKIRDAEEAKAAVDAKKEIAAKNDAPQTAPAAVDGASPRARLDDETIMRQVEKLIATEKEANKSAVTVAGNAKTERTAAEKALTRLLKNDREGDGQADRWHFLPPAFDIPPLLVDFLEIESMPLADLHKGKRLATLASPFAEALGTRFVRYLARLGTPDLDLDETLLLLASVRRNA